MKPATAFAVVLAVLATAAKAQTVDSGGSASAASAISAAAQAAPSDSSPAGSSAAADSAAASEVQSPPQTQKPPQKGGFVGVDIPPPPPGKGEVVFFRKLAFQGSAVWFKVRENGQELGKLSNGRYFIQVADAGTHTYTAATENKDTLKLDVDPGEIYFVQGEVTMGFFIGEANLTPSDEATFEKEAHKLKLSDPPEPSSSAPSKAASH